MIGAQRFAAGQVARVLTGHSLAAGPRAAEQAPETERAMATDLTLGTLRHLGLLRAVLNILARRQPAPLMQGLLLVGLYQLWATRAAPHAVVDHTVATARSLGLDAGAGFANAVLRRFLREREALLEQARRDPEGRWSHPGWWIEKLRAQYPAQHEAILAAGLLHPPMTLRVNRRRVEPDAYLARLEAEGIGVRRLGAQALLLDRPMPAARLPGFADGWVSVQDAGAQWAAPLLDLADGQRVLDACAAPGGKCAHMLELADVEMWALDRDPRRLGDLRSLLDRLHLRAHALAADAGEPAAWWDGRAFDRILLDAPCSASGIVRRHPDAKWLRRPTDIAKFARTQGRLLDALWQVLGPGGKLLYATCSVFFEENGGVIQSFLARQPDARLQALPAFPGTHGQLIPDAEHDGFFYALLAKPGP